MKGRTSRILRKEFPHLKEWCGEHMWAPSCFHGSVGNGWDVVSKILNTGCASCQKRQLQASYLSPGFVTVNDRVMCIIRNAKPK